MPLQNKMCDPNLLNLCVTIYGKRDFAGVFQCKILRWGDYPAPENHKSSTFREARDQSVGDVMTEQ